MFIYAMAVEQFLLILMLMLVPATLIYCEMRDENMSLNSARLIMKTRSGILLEREPRGAVGTADQSGIGTPAPTSTASRDNKRARNNKKSNKAQDHAGASIGGRKSGFKKVSGNGNDNSQRNRQKMKQQQHHQQQQLHQEQQVGNEKWSEPKEVKTSENDKVSTCRYAKSVWSDCDSSTNMRTRILSLKKGEANCLSTRTIQKKCKKDCRYEKGPWSDCIGGQITREDKLRPSDGHTGGTEQSCDPVRTVYKKCNPGGKQRGIGVNRSGNKERKHKEKGTRRTLQTQLEV